MLVASSRQHTRRPSLVVFVLVLTLLSAARAAAQSVSFAGRDYPDIGLNYVAADFNADGHVDLAGAGVNVSVMLGNGDGTFGPKVVYPAGGFSQDIATGDLNADGKLDLVVTNNDPSLGLTVLLGIGDGTFTAPVSFPNDTGRDSPSVAVADFDHDGRLDVVVAHQIGCFTAPCVPGEVVSLWRGIGDGSFQPPQQIPVGTGPARLVVADFNNDGHRDLGIAAAAGKVFVLLGNGDGTFRQLPDLLIVAGVDNTDIGSADFNGDLIPDLAVAADADHRTVVLLGNGDGTFRPSASIPDALQERPGELTIADFDGDSFQDVALGMSLCCSVAGDGLFGVLYGNGDGTFKPIVRYLVPGFVIGNAGGSLIASDFNGDSKQDIALQVRGNNPGLTVLVNTTGSTPAPLALGSMSISPTSVVGGVQAEINVSLAPGAVAPAGSTALTVTSGNASVVSVPSGIRIIAGMSNVRFRVNTSRVTALQTVTIIVSNKRLGTRKATLMVTPPTEPLALGALQVQPAAVFGGTGATGSVSLTTGNVAPSGGAVVSLTNDNPSLVSMPLNVVIPAGQSSASFPINTQQTGLTTAVTLTGTYGGASKSATLTVSAPSQPVAISAVTLTPQTVVGGSTQGVRVQVTLAQPAPPERATISLSSNAPNVVRLPPSLQIDTGFTSGFADFTTAPVSTPTQVTITATYGGSTQSAVLNVTPPPPSSGPTLTAVSVSPSAVNGGDSAQGTITLSAPAQAATVVSLASSSAVAIVPASATVPAGASSASFNVATTSVTSTVSATISATQNGTTRGALLTINPAPAPADTVAIQRAEYDTAKRMLRVEATSTRTTATLQVFVTSSGQLLGTLTNNGGGKYSAELSAATNPQSITVRSSLGGSATKAVITK